MDYKTHIVGGIGLAYASTQVLQIQTDQVAIFYACSALGSILPDIDHPEAFVSRYIPILPSLLYNTVGHRTFTHSILFTLIIFLIVSSFNLAAGVGLGLGIASHILLDMLSPYGVSFMYPFNKKRIKLM